MRVLLDANVLLDCLILEANGLPRAGKQTSDQVLELCDLGIHHGLVAWHTLPIIDYYHSRQNAPSDTAEMMDELLTMLEVPTVGHQEALTWRSTGLTDFEDALQIACAIAGKADLIVTRNIADFANSSVQTMTPEEFLTRFP